MRLWKGFDEIIIKSPVSLCVRNCLEEMGAEIHSKGCVICVWRLIGYGSRFCFVIGADYASSAAGGVRVIPDERKNKNTVFDTCTRRTDHYCR